MVDFIWPEKLKLKFTASDKHQVTSKLVVDVTLFTKSKNNHILSSLITNSEGEIYLTRKQLERTIEENFQEYPMDYSSVLEDCLPKILVEVESRKSLSEGWKRMKEFYPKEAKKIKFLIDGEANFIPKKVKQYIDILQGQDSYEVIIPVQVYNGKKP